MGRYQASAERDDELIIWNMCNIQNMQGSGPPGPGLQNAALQYSFNNVLHFCAYFIITFQGSLFLYSFCCTFFLYLINFASSCQQITVTYLLYEKLISSNCGFNQDLHQVTHHIFYRSFKLLPNQHNTHHKFYLKWPQPDFIIIFFYFPVGNT